MWKFFDGIFTGNSFRESIARVRFLVLSAFFCQLPSFVYNSQSTFTFYDSFLQHPYPCSVGNFYDAHLETKVEMLYLLPIFFLSYSIIYVEWGGDGFYSTDVSPVVAVNILFLLVSPTLISACFYCLDKNPYLWKLLPIYMLHQAILGMS